MAVVFTVIAAFWGRVEYQIKQCTPWWKMSKGPAAAQRSVLLDYVSPMLPVAWYRSLRNNHSAVSASIAIAMLLKLTIVVSTGLITLSREAVLRDRVALTTVNSFSNNTKPFANIGTLPYKTMQGVIVNNLTYPDGTSDCFAFQTIDHAQVPDNGEVSGVVDGFSSELDCEVASMEVHDLHFEIPLSTPAHVGPFLLSSQTLSAGACTANVSIQDLRITDYNNPELSNGTASRSTDYFLFHQTSCGNSTKQEDGRIAVAFGTVAQGPRTSFGPNRPISDGYTIDVNGTRSVQMLCKPTYHIQKLQVSTNTSTLPARSAPKVKVVNELRKA